MMYLIIGRTGSGKTHLANLLERHGLSRVKSRTTRAPRSKSEDGYIFVNEDDAAACQNRITDTVINGATYYTTPDDLGEKDFYVIDPIGAKKLAEAMPDCTSPPPMTRCVRRIPRTAMTPTRRRRSMPAMLTRTSNSPSSNTKSTTRRT